MMTYCAKQRIRWIFNPPGAPWMGGAWERLVGTVKRAFNKAVGRKKLAFPEFLTVVTEIEAVVNTRPLVACSPNVEDIPLRPVDFLHKSLKYGLAPLDPDELQDPTFDPQLIQTVTQAKQALENSEIIAEKFWERWHFEYLTALREMQVVHRKQARHQTSREPHVNEIVLVEQDSLPRGSWCYGKIIEVVRSADNMIRSVKILMPNKHIWHRPLSKIYPLEISSPVCNEATEVPTQSREQNTAPDLPSTKFQRRAKLKAIQAIKESSVTNTTNSLGNASVMVLTAITNFPHSSEHSSVRSNKLYGMEPANKVTRPYFLEPPSRRADDIEFEAVRQSKKTEHILQCYLICKANVSLTGQQVRDFA
ncbi:unnamed protein product [Haemonchus placei]|uniref:DUF5641 domain-containing protein n=1 Tax=Haemonchus placei TaxID=6290 RepID=A0A0N4VT50_HAEPC|nr:unnamed protein product [Haemonchus placei]